jgi:tRNA U55 pseudouridine synthase TruB
LGRDLAESLGTAAVMSALVRTAIGPWTLDTAVDPRTLTEANWQAHLDPLCKALSGLSVRELTSAEVSRVRRGLFIPLCAAAESQEIAAVDGGGRLVAILVPRGPGLWGPAKNFEV